MPSPCQCILSEPDVLLEGQIHLLFSLFHLLNPDPWLSRAEPWACVPVEQGVKWERKILKQKLGATDVFCVGYTVSKNDYGQLLSRV